MLANTNIESFEKVISRKHINRINKNQLSKSEEIAKGAFGNIHKAEWKVYKLTVALKSLRADISSDQNTMEDFMKELQLLQKLGSHPNINTFYGISEDSCNRFCMVLEFASDGNLRQYLKTNFSSLKWSDKLRMAKELTLGLFFLHNNDIMHRDLHSKNILVNEGSIKITDFGLSTSLNEKPKPRYFTYGMPAYVEPQYFKNPNYEFTKKSDIYSLGVILWEITSGKPPYQSFTSIDAIAVYIFQGKRETPVENTPEEYINIYKECWNEEPDKRPEAKQVLETLKILYSEIS
ncbi:kinase-like domain-containing protein [Gigaspora rosea]|uniref:Kinase-like domain-containing protein n=1 Tax=Gigaspora rosea TaxID=44941 RepID=A0A397VTC2_9GLOM|nr:kinase-like domain-containing protein [Gigaspora rosea]